MTDRKLELADLVRRAAGKPAQQASVIAKSEHTGDVADEFKIAMMQESRRDICFWADELENEVRRDGEAS